jgi:hypothetical protein
MVACPGQLVYTRAVTPRWHDRRTPPRARRCRQLFHVLTHCPAPSPKGRAFSPLLLYRHRPPLYSSCSVAQRRVHHHPYPLLYRRRSPFASLLLAIEVSPLCSGCHCRIASAISRPSLCSSGLPSTGILILIQVVVVPRASHPPGCHRSHLRHLNADIRGRPWRCPTVDTVSTPPAPRCSSAKPPGS